MLAVASLKRSLEFDPVEQGVKRKRAEIKLSPTTFTINNNNNNNTSSSSPSKQQSIFVSPSSSTLSTKKQSSSLTSSTDDKPMFTYTQAAQMCAHLLREQDKSIREQYEQLLTTKLNEQYEQFITYSHDSVHKNPSKQKLFHFGQQQQQQSDNTSTLDFSYSS